MAERIRAKVLRLAESKYAGFNDWHFTEKLQEEEGMELSRETVRRILRGAGRPSPQKRGRRGSACDASGGRGRG